MFNQSDSAGAALRPTLGAMARHNLWPTPTVTGNNNRPGASKKSGTGLATAVRMWPTPTAQDAEQAGGRACIEKGNRRPSLSYAAQMFPTPAARDYRSPNAKSFEERGGGSRASNCRILWVAC